MSRVFIGIGSNEGDRELNISRAVAALHETAGVRVSQLAMLLETAPVGGPPQGPYLNTVIEIETSLPPPELLVVLKAIEQRLGRVASTVRWGPRPIDLDLLLYGDQVIDTPNLTVPHPRLHERRFVLEPLAQLAPDLAHPVSGQSIRDLLDRLPASPAASRAA